MERSTGEGVSLGFAKEVICPEAVPYMAGLELVDGGVDPLLLDCAIEELVFGERRLRMPPGSSPLDEIVRFRCGRCCGCVIDCC